MTIAINPRGAALSQALQASLVYEDHAALIRAARVPLPSHERTGPGLRRWTLAVMSAECAHSRDDFWRAVYSLCAAGGRPLGIDRDDGFGGHETPYRYPHEVHAASALNFLSHLGAHESDRRGPWAILRWETWSAAERAAWVSRWWYLARGVVRNVRKYRAARGMGL